MRIFKTSKWAITKDYMTGAAIKGVITRKANCIHTEIYCVDCTIYNYCQSNFPWYNF